MPFGAAAVAAVAAGEVELALQLAEEGLAIARATHYRGRLGRALRLVADVDASQRLALLEEAVAVLATTQRTLEHAYALADLETARIAAAALNSAHEALGDARELAGRA